MKRTLAVTGLALLGLAAPTVASAAPGGTWAADDLTKPTVSWSTGADPAVAVVRVVLTQDVVSAAAGPGQHCGVGNDHRTVECDLEVAGGPRTAASGTIALQTTAAVGCADTFAFSTDPDGRGTFTAGSAITPAKACPEDPSGPPPPPPPPPPVAPTTGDVNATAGAGVVVAPPRFPVVAGAGSGGGPRVKVFSGGGLSESASFFGFDPSFQGGVRVAVGDVTGDGRADVVAGAGPGAGPHVKVFDGATGGLVRSFFAYAPNFAGGVSVAAGDVNGDGRADVITGAGDAGNSQVKVFDGVGGAELRSFFAYAGFGGGVNVAAGDVNGDGRDDVITGAGPGGGPHLKVFSGANGAELRSFSAFAGNVPGGVFVGAGDVNGDGRDDIAVGSGSGNDVRVFDGADGSGLAHVLPYAPGFTGGVRVAVGDVNGDGRADVVTGAGPGAGPHVKVFDGVSGAQLRSFFAFDPSFTGGVFVGAGDPAAISAPKPRPTTVDPSRGTFKLGVTCPPRTLGACKGKIKLFLATSKRSPRAAAATTPTVMGTGSFSVRPGRTGAASMRLNSRGLKNMSKDGRITLSAAVTSKDSAGNATTATIAKLVVKAKRPQR